MDDLNLIELATGVFVLVPSGDPAYGKSNLGLIIDADGLTIIDTMASPQRAHRAKAEITRLTAELELPVKRVALTSSRVPFSGGSWAFWQAAFYGSEATSDQLDEPLNLLALQRLLPELAEAYHEEFETRRITHTISEAAYLTPAVVARPVPGESPVGLILQVPGAEAVFAGASASFGVTPLAFDGDPAAWAATCDALLMLGTTIVPGHGLPGGEADVADLRDYLLACVAVDGDPSAFPAGPWDKWSDRRFDAVNIERAARLARGDTSTPQAMFDLLGL